MSIAGVLALFPVAQKLLSFAIDDVAEQRMKRDVYPSGPERAWINDV